MNPHIINYSFSSSTATSVLPIPSIDIDCGTCRQACLDQLCVLLDDGWIPAQPIHPSIQTVQYRGVVVATVVVVYTMANDAAAEREIPFVVCNCCAHRLPENVTGILIFNRHSAFVHPIRSYVFAHSRALPGLDWTRWVKHGWWTNGLCSRGEWPWTNGRNYWTISESLGDGLFRHFHHHRRAEDDPEAEWQRPRQRQRQKRQSSNVSA